MILDRLGRLHLNRRAIWERIELPLALGLAILAVAGALGTAHCQGNEVKCPDWTIPWTSELSLPFVGMLFSILLGAGLQRAERRDLVALLLLGLVSVVVLMMPFLFVDLLTHDDFARFSLVYLTIATSLLSSTASTVWPPRLPCPT